MRQLKLKNGFSLLELLVVMLIMSIALGLFLGYNFAQRDTAQLRSAANEAVQFLRMAQGFALLEGTDNECLYLSEGHLLRESLRGRELTLPEVVRLVPGDQVSRNEDVLSMAMFYSDGSARADVITLTVDDWKMVLTVDPILGDTSMEEQVRVQ